MAGKRYNCAQVSGPQSDCVELKWKKADKAATEALKPQSDCVELKWQAGACVLLRHVGLNRTVWN